MNRRHFLAAGLGSVVAATATTAHAEENPEGSRQPQVGSTGDGAAPVEDDDGACCAGGDTADERLIFR